MNSIDIRTEKANAVFRHRNLHNLIVLVRLIEICLFVVAISMFSSQFPSFSVKLNADYFKGFALSSFSPRLVFVIGNVIVVILLVKSRDNGNDRYGRIDVYDEYVKRCQSEKVIHDGEVRRKFSPAPESRRSSETVVNGGGIRRKSTGSDTDRGMLRNAPSPEIYRSRSEMIKLERDDGQTRRNIGETPLPEIYRSRPEIIKLEHDNGQIRRNIDETSLPEIHRSRSEVMNLEHDDGQTRRKLARSVTERGILNTTPSPENIITRSVTERGILKNFPSPEICRSQSEKMMKVECDDGESRRKLRRSVTSETTTAEIRGVDELSSEAFRRTVEAFIAKQQQSLRDEELTSVPYICG